VKFEGRIDARQVVPDAPVLSRPGRLTT